MDEQFLQAHALRMQEKKAEVQAAIGQAQQERGVLLVLTGDGKGKSTSAFGMVLRALGHGLRVGVVQFIKGSQASGEVTFLLQQGLLGSGPQAAVQFHAMATGCTWNSNDWQADKAAADQAWQAALQMLRDPGISLLVLDEVTLLLKYQYLTLDELLQAVQARPATMNLVLTGREAPAQLLALADTVSEIASKRHAFQAGIKAQAGVDF